MTIASKILNSKHYVDGDEFTSSRMHSALNTETKSGVAAALKTLVDRGKLVVTAEKRRGGIINIYKRPATTGMWLRVPWGAIQHSAEHTPTWC